MKQRRREQAEPILRRFVGVGLAAIHALPDDERRAINRGRRWRLEGRLDPRNRRVWLEKVGKDGKASTAWRERLRDPDFKARWARRLSAVQGWPGVRRVRGVREVVPAEAVGRRTSSAARLRRRLPARAQARPVVREGDRAEAVRSQGRPCDGHVRYLRPGPRGHAVGSERLAGGPVRPRRPVPRRVAAPARPAPQPALVPRGAREAGRDLASALAGEDQEERAAFAAKISSAARRRGRDEHASPGASTVFVR